MNIISSCGGLQPLAQLCFSGEKNYLAKKFGQIKCLAVNKYLAEKNFRQKKKIMVKSSGKKMVDLEIKIGKKLVAEKSSGGKKS